MSQRVLVIGGAGFIGSHVADAYLKRGDRVWILDDLSSGRMSNVPAQATFVQASINDEAVEKLFQEVGGFDIVNHHAAQMDVRTSVETPRFDARLNSSIPLTSSLISASSSSKTQSRWRKARMARSSAAYRSPVKPRRLSPTLFSR